MSMRSFAKAKYGNVRSTCGDHSHASKLESAVCWLLSLRQKAGEIRDLRSQVAVKLTKAEITYIADFRFTFTANEEIGFAEAKGFKTPEWRLKLRLWRHYGPGVLEIYEGNYARPKLVETVVPKGVIDV